jgi:cytochrome c
MRISAAFTAVAVLILTACSQLPVNPSIQRGQAAIGKYGCGSCHTIRGISEAQGLVGPPLTGIRNRIYIAGMLENNPGNLALWIRDPKSVNQRTAMPNLGVTPREAADISAFLNSE